jgi:hypothetical protein
MNRESTPNCSSVATDNAEPREISICAQNATDDGDTDHSSDSDSEDESSAGATLGRLAPLKAPATSERFVCCCGQPFRRSRSSRRKRHTDSKTHTKWLREAGIVVCGLLSDISLQDASHLAAAPPTDAIEERDRAGEQPQPTSAPVLPSAEDVCDTRPATSEVSSSASCMPTYLSAEDDCDARPATSEVSSPASCMPIDAAAVNEAGGNGGEIGTAGGASTPVVVRDVRRCRECPTRLVDAKYRDLGVCGGCFRKFCRTERKKVRPNIHLALWATYFGNVRYANCLGCTKRIDGMGGAEWHASHIISHANGGDTELENLLPMCAGCNLRTGRDNISQDIINKYEELRLQTERGFAPSASDVAPEEMISRLRQLSAAGFESLPMALAIATDQWLGFQAGRRACSLANV